MDGGLDEGDGHGLRDKRLGEHLTRMHIKSTFISLILMLISMPSPRGWVGGWMGWMDG